MQSEAKTPTNKTLIKVFISYKRDDNLYNHLIRVVNRTFDLLNNSEKYYKGTDFEAEPFLDCNSIGYGENWKTKVESSVKDSDMLLEYTYFNEMKNTKKQLCIPVFWSKKDETELKLNRADSKEFNDSNTQKDAKMVWDEIVEFNGFEGVLPKLVEVLAKANDSDYDYVESCIATWLADKIYKVSDPILSGEINKEEDEENEADKIESEKIAGIVLKAQSKGIKATCICTKDHAYIVKAGSELVRDLTATCPASVPKRREQEKDAISEDYVLVKDLAFKSPSAASAFVLGRSSNGKEDWKTEDGKKLGELLKEEKEKAAATQK